MAVAKINPDLYIGNTNKQLKDCAIVDTYSIDNYLINSWSTNGSCLLANYNGIKIIHISIRNGTNKTITNTLPNAMKPNTTVLTIDYNGSNGNYVSIDTNGSIKILDSNQVGENVIFTAIYF